MNEPAPTLLTHLSCGRALESSPRAGFVSPFIPTSTRPAAAPWKSSPRAGLVSPAMTRRSCTDEHYQ